MKLFMYDSDADIKVNRIIELIKLRKDGEVSHLIQSTEHEYKVNYGASILHLKQVASQFVGSTALAELLWYREIRETMIIASIIANPNDFTVKQCVEWSRLINATELAEHFSMHLVAKMSNLEMAIVELLREPNEKQKMVALFSLGWALKYGFSKANDFTNRVVIEVIDNHKGCSLGFYRGLGYALRQLIRHSELGKQQAEYFLKHQKGDACYGLKLMIEEVNIELEYLNHQQ